MLVDFLELKGILSAPLSAAVDGGSKTNILYTLHMHRKAPWLMEYMNEYTSGGSRSKTGQLNSSETSEADRLIAVYRELQEKKKNAK
jgi:hypothetical protein